MKKIMIAASGLIFILLILELTLRVAGHYSHGGSDAEYLSAGDDKYDFTALCLGDSFTQGMGAPVGMDYPSQLERLLNERSDGSYKVINGGLLGANSSQILNNRRANLRGVRPDLIVVLFGGANNWNHWGYGSYKKDGGKPSLSDHLYRIRLYKLAILLFDNIRNKLWAGAPEKEPTTLNKESYRKAREEFLRAAATNPNDGRAYYRMGGFFLSGKNAPEALKYFKNGLKAAPAFKGNYIGVALARQLTGDLHEGILQLKKGMKKYPEDLNFYYHLSNFYHSLGNFEEQAKWTLAAIRMNPAIKNFYRNIAFLRRNVSVETVAAIDSLLRGRPPDDALRTIKFEYPGQYVAPGEDSGGDLAGDKAEILKWVEADLDHIREYSSEVGATLIILDYPLRLGGNPWDKDIKPLNHFLERYADREDLLFIDNYKIFNAFGPEQDKYFEPRGMADHCNARGYGLMARKVYDIIIEKNLLK